MHIYIYICKYICIYTNVPVYSIVRLLHPRSGDSQDQEAFIATSVDNQTSNYDIECSIFHPSLSTLRSNGLYRSVPTKFTICQQSSYDIMNQHNDVIMKNLSYLINCVVSFIIIKLNFIIIVKFQP